MSAGPAFLAPGAYVASLNRVGTLLITSRRDRLQARRDFDGAIAVSSKLLAQTPSDVHALAQLAIAYGGKAEIAGRDLRPNEMPGTVDQVRGNLTLGHAALPARR